MTPPDPFRRLLYTARFPTIGRRCMEYDVEGFTPGPTCISGVDEFAKSTAVRAPRIQNARQYQHRGSSPG